jgi:hypothetical protein
MDSFHHIHILFIQLGDRQPDSFEGGVYSVYVRDARVQNNGLAVLQDLHASSNFLLDPTMHTRSGVRRSGRSSTMHTRNGVRKGPSSTITRTRSGVRRSGRSSTMHTRNGGSAAKVGVRYIHFSGLVSFSRWCWCCWLCFMWLERECENKEEKGDKTEIRRWRQRVEQPHSAEAKGGWWRSWIL